MGNATSPVLVNRTLCGSLATPVPCSAYASALSDSAYTGDDALVTV